MGGLRRAGECSPRGAEELLRGIYPDVDYKRHLVSASQTSCAGSHTHFTQTINAVSIQGIINKWQPLSVPMRFGMSGV